MQIADDARQLGKYTGLSTVTLIGGADYAKQLAKVNDRVTDIVVATPGRLIDFIQRGDMYLDRVESLVLDEADRMLDMGFIPQVKRIVRSTPRKEDRQTPVFGDLQSGHHESGTTVDVRSYHGRDRTRASGD